MIPKHIILTWKDHQIPPVILDAWKRLNPEYTILFFTDKDILQFLQTHYGEEYCTFFSKIPFGRYKSDFFRYCYLYKCGGFYVDIDIEPLLSIEEVLPSPLSFLSIVSTYFPEQIFQAVLWSEANHPILARCICSMLYYGSNIGIDPPDVYPFRGHPTVCMYTNMCKLLQCSAIQEGVNGDSSQQIVMGIERRVENRQGIFIQGKLFGYDKYLHYDRDHGFKIQPLYVVRTSPIER